MIIMLTPTRMFPLAVSLLLLSACNWGGSKGDASDNNPPTTTPPASAPTRGQLLTKPAPLVKSYSTTDVLALLGGFSGIGGGPFYGTGYYGGGGLGLVIVILLILLLMGRL